jgi:hypothetical protein
MHQTYTLLIKEIGSRGVPRGMHRMHVHPPSPLCIPPPAMCIPPLPLKGWL